MSSSFNVSGNNNCSNTPLLTGDVSPETSDSNKKTDNPLEKKIDTKAISTLKSIPHSSEQPFSGSRTVPDPQTTDPIKNLNTRINSSKKKPVCLCLDNERILGSKNPRIYSQGDESVNYGKSSVTFDKAQQSIKAKEYEDIYDRSSDKKRETRTNSHLWDLVREERDVSGGLIKLFKPKKEFNTMNRSRNEKKINQIQDEIYPAIEPSPNTMLQIDDMYSKLPVEGKVTKKHSHQEMFYRLGYGLTAHGELRAPDLKALTYRYKDLIEERLNLKTTFEEVTKKLKELKENLSINLTDKEKKALIDKIIFLKNEGVVLPNSNDSPDFKNLISSIETGDIKEKLKIPGFFNSKEWEELTPLELPNFRVFSSDGIADDFTFAETFLFADVTLSSDIEFLHDSYIHIFRTLAWILPPLQNSPLHNTNMHSATGLLKFNEIAKQRKDKFFEIYKVYATALSILDHPRLSTIEQNKQDAITEKALTLQLMVVDQITQYIEKHKEVSAIELLNKVTSGVLFLLKNPEISIIEGASPFELTLIDEIKKHLANAPEISETTLFNKVLPRISSFFKNPELAKIEEKKVSRLKQIKDAQKNFIEEIDLFLRRQSRYLLQDVHLDYTPEQLLTNFLSIMKFELGCVIDVLTATDTGPDSDLSNNLINHFFVDIPIIGPKFLEFFKEKRNGDMNLYLLKYTDFKLFLKNEIKAYNDMVTNLDKTIPVI